MVHAHPELHSATPAYVGRFAPSPSGPLHEGSLVAALASFLDARAHMGRWLIRIEDVDTPRTAAGADRAILHQLAALGLHADEPPTWQSGRHTLYEQACRQLQAAGRIYPCRCTRRELPPGPYPGTCRPAATGQDIHPPSTASRSGGRPPGGRPAPQRPVRSWRFRVAPGLEHFQDRWLGAQNQDVERAVGDFIIRRAGGLWAYQLAVVVDDADQGVTDVVRGADLLDSTARQRQLAHALGLVPPRTLHVPLIVDAHGHKLSKQNHAPALDLRDPLARLQEAWSALGFEAFTARDAAEFLAEATPRWGRRFP